MDFDIFNPQETKVIKGLGGKIITIYGISGTGDKTVFKTE